MEQALHLAEYYQARAPEYDAVYAKPERQADLRMLEAELPENFSDSRAIEVACGTGYWTQFIARSARSVTAVDIAPATLAIASSRCKGMRAEFVRADSFALPFSPASFDAAFAGFWISHVRKSQLSLFLSGLNTCLEAGARVVFLDNLYVDGNSTPIAAHDSEGNTFQDRRLADGSTTRVLKNFPREAELRALVGSYARAAEYRALEYYWTFSYELRAA